MSRKTPDRKPPAFTVDELDENAPLTKEDLKSISLGPITEAAKKHLERRKLEARCVMYSQILPRPDGEDTHVIISGYNEEKK